MLVWHCRYAKAVSLYVSMTMQPMRWYPAWCTVVSQHVSAQQHLPLNSLWQCSPDHSLMPLQTDPTLTFQPKCLKTIQLTATTPWDNPRCTPGTVLDRHQVLQVTLGGGHQPHPWHYTTLFKLINHCSLIHLSMLKLECLPLVWWPSGWMCW